MEFVTQRVTGNKIVNNLVFWGLAIVPVYSLAMAGDLLILNTIEFWTGNKLLGDASVPGGEPAAAENGLSGGIDPSGLMRRMTPAWSTGVGPVLMPSVVLSR